MFKKFRVKNFMCLKDVTVELEPVTVFIGPNSSGKSAFFKALTTFSKLFWYPVREGPTGDFNIESGVTLDEAVWNGDSSLPIEFHVWFDDSASQYPDYSLTLRRDYRGWSVAAERFKFEGDWLDTGTGGFEFDTSQGSKNWPGPYKAPLSYLIQRFAKDAVAEKVARSLQAIRARVGQTRRYRPSASDIAWSVKSSTGNVGEEQLEVTESGRGLPTVLQDMLGKDRQTFESMEKDLQGLHNHIRGMSFKRDWRGTGLFYRTSRAAQDTPACLESDGVLLSTFLLWRLYSAPANLKLCLEEPENGVHLAALKQRYDLLKRFAADKADTLSLQVLIATHSRDFLNAIQTRNDIVREIRVTEFDPVNGTRICTLHHYREIDQLLTEFKCQMGDLWWSNRLQHFPRQ